MHELGDAIPAGRAVDLSDGGQRGRRVVAGAVDEGSVTLDEPTILVAEDLTPSDTATLDPDMILGLCTARGGPTSHTAILARGFGMPAIVGAGEAVLDVANGTLGILDGESGKLYLKPSEADVRAARDLQQQLQRQQDEAHAASSAPAITTDGYRVEVAANINRAADVPKAIEAGAEGVGLMRTEFLFLARDSAPSEEEQFEAYRAMAQALADPPLIFRTLDIKGHQQQPYPHLPHPHHTFLPD